MNNAILTELIKRNKSKVDVLSAAFPKQLLFLKDPSKLKATHCPRRSAKSYTAGLGMIDKALKNPRTKCFYLTLTRDMARNIMWTDVLKKIDEDFSLGCDFNETLLECRLPNGSIIRLMGVDADVKQQRKLLGQKYVLVVIDEAAFYTIDLRTFVMDKLMPATFDLGGEIWLMSTSSDITRGFYYDVCHGTEKGWSLHEWTFKDNPHMANKVESEIAKLVEANPLIVNTSGFKQMYLNEWTVDSEKLVYHYSKELNTISMLPQRVGAYSYILGLDFGWRDDTAFVVAAFHPNDSTLYFVEAFKAPKMDYFDVAAKIEQLDDKYSFDVKVADGSAKQGIETLNNRFGTDLICAERTSKQDHIALMNSELITGKIKLLPAALGIADEWMTLIWKDKGATGREEHPSMPNHLSDSALYSWFYCYPYLSKEAADTPKPYSKEWFVAQEKKQIDQMLNRVNKKKNTQGGPHRY